MSKLKGLANETVLYGFGNMIPRLLNFLLFPIHTKFFHAEEYGTFTYLMSLVGILNVVYSFGMETSYFRFATKAGANEKKVFQLAQTIVIGISLLISSLFLLFSSSLAYQLGIPDKPHYIVWLTGILFIDNIVAVPFARLRLQKKPIQFALYRISNVIILTALTLFFLYANYDASIGIGYIILATLIANTFYLIFFIKTLITWRPLFDRTISPTMAQYAYPIMLTGLAGMTNEFFSRISLEHWLPEGFYPGKSSEHAQGVFGASYKFSVFMNLTVQAFRLAAEPFFFSNASTNDSGQRFAQINHYFIVVCCFIMVAIGINTDVLKYIFLQREEYWDGLDVVPPLLLGYLLLGVYYNFTVWFKLTDKTHFGTIITVAGTVITIIANYILIPKAGYVGSSWATVLCFLFMAIACYYFGQRYYPIPYKMGAALLYITISFALIYLVNRITFDNQWLTTSFHAAVLLVYIVVVYLIEKRALKQALA
jgi:O-antigen/teichoic acid export membrane protein